MMKTARWQIGLLMAGILASYPALGGTMEVKTLNRGPTGFFVFDPDLVRIKQGDTIIFVATDKGHEIHSVPGLIPVGAKPFSGKLNQDTEVTFTEPGVYIVACQPHTLLGMVEVVVVGDPVNLDEIDPASLPGKAQEKVRALLQQIKKG